MDLTNELLTSDDRPVHRSGSPPYEAGLVECLGHADSQFGKEVLNKRCISDCVILISDVTLEHCAR